MKTKSEAEQAIEKINNGLEFELGILTYKSDGYFEYIEFLGKNIWDSDNDEREWNDNDEREPLDKHIMTIMLDTFIQLNKQLLRLTKMMKDKK